MVVEELVARLGFKVDGLGELKKFENGLKQAQKGVSSFGTALNKWLSGAKMGALSGASAIGGKMAQGFKAAASSIAMAAASAARMAAVTAAFSAALVGAVALAAKLAYNFVKARGEAARMRREMQLTAEGSRTKIGSLEGLQKGLDAIAGSGALKDVAKSFVGQIAKEADAEIRGEGEKKYDKNGIKLLDGAGRQRDTAAVAIDVLSKYADLIKKGQIARREAAIEEAKGNKKGQAAAEGRANKTELEARKFANDFGIDGELMASIRALRGGAEEFQKRMSDANKNNPGLTSEEEDRKKQLAEQFTALANKFEGISESVSRAFGNMADIISLKIIPALDGLADTLLSWGKKLNIIPETKGEVEDRNKAKADAAKDPAGIAAAQKAAEDALKNSRGGAEGSFIRYMFGMGDAADKLIEAAQAYKNAKANREATAGESVSQDSAKGTEKIFQDAATKLIEAFKQLQDVQKKNSPETQSKAAGEKAEKKVVHDNRNNIGNDQRTNTVTITQTVNGAADAAKQAAAAVLGAVSTKASVSTTAATTAP